MSSAGYRQRSRLTSSTYVFFYLSTSDEISWLVLGETEINSCAPGIRPKCSIFPTAKVTDASNSSKPALKSHKAAADAQRAAEARKAVEREAQQAADAVQDRADTDAPAGPVPPPPISLSRSSSQVILSRNTSPGTHIVSSEDEPEECVRPPKGKRKAIGMLT